MSDTVLDVRHLTVEIRQGNEPLVPVRDVSFSVKQGRITGLIGESGCGKTMAARAVMGLLKPNCRIAEGTIVFDGRDITHLSPQERSSLSGDQMSMIFQEPMTALNPLMKAGDQVEEVLRIHRKLSPEEARDRTVDLFREVGIPDSEKRMNAYPHELSGGLRQRVMIAMAMILKPKLLIADEPTTALDVITEAQILKLMKQLCREGTGILLISHNPGVIAEVCDEVSVMYAGTIAEQADVYELFDHPLHPYTRGLFSAVRSLREDPDELSSIPGSVPDLSRRFRGCVFSDRCPCSMVSCMERKPDMKDIGNGHLLRCHQKGEPNESAH